MAFAMTTQGQASGYLNDNIQAGNLPFSTATPGIQLEVTGTANTRVAGSVQTLPIACTRFRVVVNVKTFTLGANTTINDGPVIYLEAADVVGMGTNLTVLGPPIKIINIASATSPGTYITTFVVATTAKGFIRTVTDMTPMGAGGSLVYDILVLAT